MMGRSFSMTPVFKGPEFAMIAVPVLFIAISKVWFNSSMVDLHIHDTMFVISTSFVFTLFLILMIFYFLMHGYLRTTQSGNKRITQIHAIGTAICLLIIFIFTLVPSVSDRPRTAVAFKNYSTYRPLEIFMAITFLIFVLVQFLFLIYFIVTTFRSLKAKL